MNRWTPLHRRSALALLTAMAVTTRSRAQTGTAPQAFPVKPITLLVPFGPGGIADITARAVAEHMGRTLGQSVVVENPLRACFSVLLPVGATSVHSLFTCWLGLAFL